MDVGSLRQRTYAAERMRHVSDATDVQETSGSVPQLPEGAEQVPLKGEMEDRGENGAVTAEEEDGAGEGEGLLPTLEKELERLERNIELKIDRITHWFWHAVSFDNLPDWLRDNEFLRHNHRPPMNSFRGCFKSMFRMHTETMNIWTHLLGFVFFVVLCLGVYIFGDYITFLFEDIEIHKLPWGEQLMIFIFFVGAMACLCCSFLFHTLSNHSLPIYYIVSRLDYSGIALLITGSSVPAFYYAFFCRTMAICVHSTISVTLGILCVVFSFWRKFDRPKFRPLRYAVFVLFGLYGCIPTAHLIVVHGLASAWEKFPGLGLGLMALLYISGATLYVLRIPERFFPGKFDIWASSHQIFHVFVFAAALVHYDTLLGMIKYRLGVDTCVGDLPPLSMLTV